MYILVIISIWNKWQKHIIFYFFKSTLFYSLPWNAKLMQFSMVCSCLTDSYRHLCNLQFFLGLQTKNVFQVSIYCSNVLLFHKNGLFCCIFKVKLSALTEQTLHFLLRKWPWSVVTWTIVFLNVFCLRLVMFLQIWAHLKNPVWPVASWHVKTKFVFSLVKGEY